MNVIAELFDVGFMFLSLLSLPQVTSGVFVSFCKKYFLKKKKKTHTGFGFEK